MHKGGKKSEKQVQRVEKFKGKAKTYKIDGYTGGHLNNRPRTLKLKVVQQIYSGHFIVTKV